MNEPNGWHHYERVYIQARSGPQMLIQYCNRAAIHREFRWRTPDGQNLSHTRSISPWAWVPVEDVTWDWQLRELA